MELSGSQILACRDLGMQAVEVPEWQGTVYVRAFTVHEVFALGTLSGAEAAVEAVLRATCNRDGEPLFTESDREALRGKNYRAVERVFKAMAEFNQIATGDGADAKESLEKN